MEHQEKVFQYKKTLTPFKTNCVLWCTLKITSNIIRFLFASDNAHKHRKPFINRLHVINSNLLKVLNYCNK